MENETQPINTEIILKESSENDNESAILTIENESTSPTNLSSIEQISMGKAMISIKNKWER